MTAVEDYLLTLPDSHPLQVAIRTYTLALSLSLGPALLSFVSSPRTRRSDTKTALHGLRKILRREFGLTGFPFAITVAVAGGAALQALWRHFEDFDLDILTGSNGLVSTFQRRHPKITQARDALLRQLNSLKRHISTLPPIHKSFLLNSLPCLLSILLMQSRHRRSHTKKASIPWTVPISPPTKAEGRTSATLDLTLMFVVRAVDAVVQRVVFRRSGGEVDGEGQEVERESEDRKRWRQRVTTRIDAMLFWASSARIMWCFFYQPERLPRSYVKWISSLASIDPRLTAALRAIRSKDFSYVHGTSSETTSLLSSLSQDLDHPSSWGDAAILPAYGGPKATKVWQELGVRGRDGVGGIPCEIVHGKMGGVGAIGGSCTKNVAVRSAYAFLEAVALYTPVHILPLLLTRPSSFLRPHRLFSLLTGILRSSTFLTTFVSSIWLSVCLSRTLLLARLFPRISHDFWDGPYGCVMAGSLVCGGSIWIENGRRRGEMGLYVMPRAVRACLPSEWLRGGKSVILVERIAFMLSLAFLTAATHELECLRGLSRWTIAFVMNGPNAGLWKRRRQATSVVSSPKAASSPPLAAEENLNEGALDDVNGKK